MTMRTTMILATLVIAAALAIPAKKKDDDR